MNEGRELWEKYCGFFDKKFSEQIEYNENKKEEHFRKWKTTKTAKQLCPEGVEKFEDIPLTTYDDYPILHEFGKKMEELERTVPRKKGEDLWGYYDRIGRQAAAVLDGWMVEKYGFCAKTSGTGGESRWFAHGEEFLKNTTKYSIAMVIMACSDNWGDTKIRKGDKILSMMAPAPYGVAPVVRAWDNFLGCLPPPGVMENITSMRKKIDIVLKTIESGEKIGYIAALPSILQQISQYFTDPAGLFKDKYQSMNLGMGKFILYLKYLQSKSKPPKYKRISEIMPVKGIGLASADFRFYWDWIENEFGVEPSNFYFSSETECGMACCLNRKRDFVPLLESHHFELMTKNGEIRKIDELEKGNVYTLIVSSFGSMMIRYNMGDIFRVVDFEQNGLPIFSFEGRVTSSISIYGYLNLSEALAVEILTKAGLRATDRWIMAKLTEPSEHILLAMEKEWDYSEQEASRVVFNVLKESSEDFRNLIRDFEIAQPSQFIEVEYLRKGAFMRYLIRKAKEGVPYGQIKPPKVINPEKAEIIDILRKI